MFGAGNVLRGPGVSSAQSASTAQAGAANIYKSIVVRPLINCRKTTHTVHLKQNGNRVDGIHQGNFLTRDISGTIDGDTITLASVVTERHGDALTYRFSGKVTGETMTGSLDLGEYLTATWSARRPASNRALA